MEATFLLLFLFPLYLAALDDNGERHKYGSEKITQPVNKVYTANVHPEYMKYMKVSSTGEASTEHSELMGIYSLQETQTNNFPVWKKLGLYTYQTLKDYDAAQYLFVSTDGYWGIGNNLDSPNTWIHLPKKDPIPESPENTEGWNFWDDTLENWKIDNQIIVEALTDCKYRYREVPSICICSHVSSPLKQDDFQECSINGVCFNEGKCFNGLRQGRGGGAHDTSESFKWENNVVPYYYSETAFASETDKDLVRKVMDTVQEKTCFRFQEKTQDEYEDEHSLEIFIQDAECIGGGGTTTFTGAAFTDGAFSLLEKVPNKKRLRLLLTGHTTDNFGNDCGYRGLVIYELMQALGVVPTHRRKDRDEFITVNFENLNSKTVEFQKREFQKCETCVLYDEIPYDCGSIMHYGTHLNGKEVIIPKRNCYLGTVSLKFLVSSASEKDYELLNIIGKCAVGSIKTTATTSAGPGSTITASTTSMVATITTAATTTTSAATIMAVQLPGCKYEYRELLSDCICGNVYDGEVCTSGQLCNRYGNCNIICKPGTIIEKDCFCKDESSGELTSTNCREDYMCTSDGNCHYPYEVSGVSTKFSTASVYSRLWTNRPSEITSWKIPKELINALMVSTVDHVAEATITIKSPSFSPTFYYITSTVFIALDQAKDGGLMEQLERDREWISKDDWEIEYNAMNYIQSDAGVLKFWYRKSNITDPITLTTKADGAKFVLFFSTECKNLTNYTIVLANCLCSITEHRSARICKNGQGCFEGFCNDLPSAPY